MEAEAAANDLGRATPHLTARNALSPAALIIVGIAVSAFLVAYLAGGACWLTVSILVSLPLCMAIGLRAAATVAGAAVSPGPERLLPDEDLPIYSVVIALYREAEVVARLFGALDRLEYPRSRLDVKFILEADDVATLRALEGLHLGREYEIIIAPHGWPRTKPRALNLALQRARGDLLVVYDAEDVPERRQLLRVASLFAQREEGVSCVQCALTIDNAQDCWLTALFALEYAALFRVLGPGLVRLGVPLPLGGTSNHFSTAVLRKIHGWDAWNVTEDADLGIRLARAGHRVCTLESPTLEEAPNTLLAWLRQRRRWTKGWMQTLLVHVRQPRRLVHELGAGRALLAAALLAGGVLGPLLGPLYAGLFVFEAVSGQLFAPTGMTGWIEATIWSSIAAVGALALVVPLVIGAQRAGLRRFLSALPLLPLYQLLLTIAALQAIWDLVSRPHHWAKTAHGLARTSLSASVDLPSSAP